MLEVKNLFKSFANKGNKKSVDAVLNDVSLILEEKKIYAILGENGSGKSTLLKLIAGLLSPDNGSIILNEIPVSRPEKKLIPGDDRVRLVFQNHNLMPNISLSENISYSLRYYPFDLQSKKLNELIQIFQLGAIKDKLPREVSGGEQQRTAIATSLATQMDILLLDEPFSNIDVFHKIQLKSILKQVISWYNGAILFVTHDFTDALSICNKVAILKKGEILQFDTPEVIFNHPKTPYVAQLSGSINLLNRNQIRHLFKNTFNILNNDSFGIRPEHLIISNSVTEIKGRVVEVNCFGSYNYILVEPINGLKLWINAGLSNYEPDDELYLSIAPKHVIFFN